MKIYQDVVKNVLENGILKPNRTDHAALTIPGAMISHDMREGFPLLTTKKMAWKNIFIELEFFIKGLTDKTWLQERGCHIWDNWCDHSMIPLGLNRRDRKDFQHKCTGLGPVYGSQWRRWNSPLHYGCVNNDGIDQLSNIIDRLKAYPNDRQLLVSAWNPEQLHQMALPPCHFAFHLVHINGVLNLTWFQRSCDVMLGLPFNLASYAMLLELICLETGLTPGIVTGMLSDVHIYENHTSGAVEQISREPYELPNVVVPDFDGIFAWTYKDVLVTNYKSHGRILFEIAV